ncbi:MAG TPA: selenocysteine-specific translation elongation factor [Gemmatimonadaceae bacterium]|nr:selenocysteine-specific translation elongation factor [Gemmatimonadaceae bacterium]
MIIGTAGHIDHGKTALVKALTGVDADRLPEEKRRGITIDLGFAPLALDGIGTVGVIDVPGHEDFVRSMLVGASGIDLGLLVVAADEGVMPQTREHLLILGLLQIPQIVVAITKSDLADADWIELVRADLLSLFAASALPSPAIVICSSRSGTGLGDLRAALADRLGAARARSSGDLFRMPVDRAFSVKGTGTVVTGTVWSGELASDGAVVILPSGKTTRARRIEQHSKVSPAAVAGSRAAIALAGVDVSEVGRGSVLVGEDRWQTTTLFEAIVSVDPEARASVSPRTRVRLHAGASEVQARLVFATAGTDRQVLARISTDSAIVLRGGDRFVLRLPAPVRTIGGGVVIDPYARRRSLPIVTPDQLTALGSSALARAAYVVDSEAQHGVALDDLPVRTGCLTAELSAFAERIGAVSGGHNLFSAGAVEQVMASIRRIVADYEIKAPLALGIPARTLREGLRVRDELADIAIREMEEGCEIESFGPVFRRPGWVPTPSAEDTRAVDRLAHDICAAVSEPPSVTELVSRYGNSVPGLLRFLERQGRIVQVETDRYYDRDAVERLVAQLRSELTPGHTYVPAELRDVLGMSRKYLIPFLEFCDRQGITERRGVGRVLKGTTGLLLDTSEAHS